MTFGVNKFIIEPQQKLNPGDFVKFNEQGEIIRCEMKDAIGVLPAHFTINYRHGWIEIPEMYLPWLAIRPL